ncbi:hypothetical protein MTO74_10415, partial [Leuconostoc mesenteroides]|nr:hypothetical protein [Leuconostoc mesenteroides]
MCGIVGFVDKKIADKKPVIEAMMDTIKHRGPNSSGELVNEDTALGFRRLSIIDINSAMQPIYNEDKSKAVIFNGEIYNYQGIREELINKGHTFTTETDTEVLLHGFEEWGMEELLKKMEVCQMVLKDSFYPLEISSCGRSFLL